MKIHSKVIEALCLVKNKTYPFSRSLIDLAGYKLRDPTGKFQHRSPSLGFWINCYKPFLRFYQSVNWTDKESSMLFFIEPCLRDGPGLLLGVISAQVLLLKTQDSTPPPPRPHPFSLFCSKLNAFLSTVHLSPNSLSVLSILSISPIIYSLNPVAPLL